MSKLHTGVVLRSLSAVLRTFITVVSKRHTGTFYGNYISSYGSFLRELHIILRVLFTGVTYRLTGVRLTGVTFYGCLKLPYGCLKLP